MCRLIGYDFRGAQSLNRVSFMALQASDTVPKSQALLKTSKHSIAKLRFTLELYAWIISMHRRERKLTCLHNFALSGFP